MVFHGLDDVFREAADLCGRAKGAVVHMPASAPGDLPDFRRAKPPCLPPVELAGLGESNVVEVHVQTHADGVGRDQIVDLPGLIHLDLLVAGPGAQRAEHHGTAAAHAFERFSDVVNIGCGKHHDGAAPRHLLQLLRRDVAEFGKARPGFDLAVGQQLPDHPGHGVGSHEHGLHRPAGVEQTVGEDVAALGVGTELHFVDGEEGDGHVQRHGLDRANPVAGVAGNDLFFAGDQRDLSHALLAHDLVVVLTGKKAEGKADHTGRVAEHALDRQKRLAGIGRAENRGHRPFVGGTSHGGDLCLRG